MVRLNFFVVFLFASIHSSVFSIANHTFSDSSKYKTISLDSLSDEDFALLEEYKDSFLTEVKEIKAVFIKNKRKPIDTTVAHMNKSSHVEIGLDFTSRALSNGRDAGVKGVMFFPSAMYYHKTGLYASISMGFFTDSTIRHSAKIPLLSVSPGFYRTFFKRWSINLGYTRNIIFYGDKFQQGLLNNSFRLYNSFNFWNYITLSMNTGISWSSNLTSKKYYLLPLRKIYYKNLTKQLGQAYSVNIGLSFRKDFSFYNVIGAKVFTVSPEFSFLFGHDNNAFITKRIFRGYLFTYDKFFGLLSLEPGLSVDWRIRNLEISVSFYCAIPFNEFDETRLDRTTNPHHYYPYAEAGIKYLFMVKKKPKKL